MNTVIIPVKYDHPTSLSPPPIFTIVSRFARLAAKLEEPDETEQDASSQGRPKEDTLPMTVRRISLSVSDVRDRHDIYMTTSWSAMTGRPVFFLAFHRSLSISDREIRLSHRGTAGIYLAAW